MGQGGRTATNICETWIFQVILLDTTQRISVLEKLEKLTIRSKMNANQTQIQHRHMESNTVLEQPEALWMQTHSQVQHGELEDSCRILNPNGYGSGKTRCMAIRDESAAWAKSFGSLHNSFLNMHIEPTHKFNTDTWTTHGIQHRLLINYLLSTNSYSVH